jgi:hypothetical protein
MQINNPLNVVPAVPYRRRVADQPASAPTSLGGLPGAAQRLGQAQSAVKGIGGTIKRVQIILTAVGGLTVATGVATAFLVGFGTGGTTILSGVVMVLGAWFALPRFMDSTLSPFKDDFALIDDLAAKAQLGQTGIPATARVMSMQPTGTTVNGGPQVQAGLEVQGPNGPYLVHTMAVIHPMYIPQFQPGATVTVRVNPQNPQDIAVVF